MLSFPKRNIYESVLKGSQKSNYRKLGYKNYEEFALKELGLKPRQAYVYLETVRRLGLDFCKNHKELGITKLSWISVMDLESRMLVLENVDIEKMSTKEFKAYIEPFIKNEEQLVL